MNFKLLPLSALQNSCVGFLLKPILDMQRKLSFNLHFVMGKCERGKTEFC